MFGLTSHPLLLLLQLNEIKYMQDPIYCLFQCIYTLEDLIIGHSDSQM